VRQRKEVQTVLRQELMVGRWDARVMECLAGPPEARDCPNAFVR
jgi:hypothetical protein